MANPGAATTVTNHPSQLATNQALRLIASAQGVNLNLVADTIAPILVSGRVSVQSIIVTNASISLDTAYLAVCIQAQAQRAQQSNRLMLCRATLPPRKWL